MDNIRFTFLSDEDSPPEVRVCGRGFIDDHTICGLSTEIDTVPGALSTETVDKKIDCFQCIAIIDGCKMIPDRYIKRKR